MANEAFQAGFGYGYGRAGEERARKEALSDLDTKTKVTQYATQLDDLQKKIPSLNPGTPERADAEKALAQTVTEMRETLHPDNNPGALAKFGHIITDALKITKPQASATMVNPKAKGLVSAGNIDIWNRPLIHNADGSSSSEYSTSFEDEHGHEVLVPTVVDGKFLTPDGKKPPEGQRDATTGKYTPSPQEEAMFKAAWDHYLKTGENLGKFATPEDASAYAHTLHSRGTVVPKNIAQKQELATKDQQEAQRMIAAAPIPKLQLDLAEMSAKLQAIESSNLDEDGKRAARGKVFGVTTALKPSWQQFKLPDGTLRSYDLNNPETIPEGATEVAKGAVTAAKVSIEDWEQEKKEGKTDLPYPAWLAAKRREGAPSTSAINEGREDYAKSHGFKSYADIPDQYRDVVMNYELRKQAMDKAYPTSTTTTSYQENYLHQTVPVVATNYKTPQGVETLKDPLWFLAAPVPKPGDGVTPSTGSTQPVSPKGLLNEAGARNPAANKPKSAKVAPTSVEAVWATQNPKPKQTGNVRVEQPILIRKNKEWDDTQTAVDGAKERVETMDKNLKAALNGDQQAMLSLVANHIGMTLGAQKGARINQAVWNEAVASAPWLQTEYAKAFHNDPQTGEMIFDGWKGGVNLTPEQMKQMVTLAHEREETLEHSLKRIEDRLNTGVANPTNSQPAGSSGNGLPPGWK